MPVPRFAAATPFPPSPMLATAATLPSDSRGYVFEAKWDGIRALARVDGRAELFSRHATNLTAYFPEITSALAASLDGRTVILDGEIVALDRRARPSFDLIQRRIRNARPAAHLLKSVPAMFFVFDLLHLDGADVMCRPYLKRRELLDSLNLRSASLMTSPYWTDIGAGAMFDVVREMGLEGVVCKRATSVYQPGRRSQNWIKSVVRQRAAFIVGGWVPGREGRIGSLLVGAHNEAGALVFGGQVGFGLSAALRDELGAKLTDAAHGNSPFADLPSLPGARCVTPSILRQRRVSGVQRPVPAPLTQGCRGCRRRQHQSSAAVRTLTAD